MLLLSVFPIFMSILTYSQRHPPIHPAHDIPDDPNRTSRRVWTKEEDEAIRALVERHGKRSWAVVEEQLATQYSIFGRSGKQCRERWHNHLGEPPLDRGYCRQQRIQRCPQVHVPCSITFRCD